MMVRQLRLFLDKDKLLRYGGRIHNAPVNELTKFLFLLPPKHPLTDMSITNVNEKFYNGGVRNSMSALLKVYWIHTICKYMYVKKQLRQCVMIICNRLSDKLYQTPDRLFLPKIRSNNWG